MSLVYKVAENEFEKHVNKALSLTLSANLDTDDEQDLEDTDFYDHIIELKKDRLNSIRTAYEFLENNDLNKRFFALSLLGQLCNPLNNQQEETDAVDIAIKLAEIIHKEKSMACLSAIATALGFTNAPQAISALLYLSQNKNEDVRFSATVSMGGFTVESVSEEFKKRLINLSNDEVAEIRSWATMWLAGLDEYDDEVLAALKARLQDDEEDTSSEAIYGFAYNNIPDGLPYLKKKLKTDSIIDKDLKSAGLYGDSTLYPLLLEWVGVAGENIVEWSMKRCSSNELVKISVDDEWFGDELYIEVERGIRKPRNYRGNQTTMFKDSNTTTSKLGYESKTMSAPMDFSINYFDFTIDGIGINAIASNSSNTQIPYVTTELSDLYKPLSKINYLKMLKGEVAPNLLSGRVGLYTCAFDGDPLCDIIGCRINFNDTTVVWSDFEWDSGSDEEEDEDKHDNDDGDTQKVTGLTAYTFDRTQYNQIMDELIAKASKEL
jgi:hypothetical protein